jgi:tetratricopeptide (TPR) repeat protein
MSEARELLQAAVRSKSTHVATYCLLADIYKQQGDIQNARDLLNIAIQIAERTGRRSYVALQALGVLESKHGDVHRARELFEQVPTYNR